MNQNLPFWFTELKVDDKKEEDIKLIQYSHKHVYIYMLLSYYLLICYEFI